MSTGMFDVYAGDNHVGAIINAPNHDSALGVLQHFKIAFTHIHHRASTEYDASSAFQSCFFDERTLENLDDLA